MPNNQFYNDVKVNHKELYWDIVKLLNEMRNGGSSLRWICNMREDSKMTRNFEKALKHIWIATEILQGTMYQDE